MGVTNTDRWRGNDDPGSGECFGKHLETGSNPYRAYIAGRSGLKRRSNDIYRTSNTGGSTTGCKVKRVRKTFLMTPIPTTTADVVHVGNQNRPQNSPRRNN